MRLRGVAPFLVVLLVVGGCTDEGTPDGSTTLPVEYLGYADRVAMVVECVRAEGFDAESYEGFGVAIHVGDQANSELGEQVEGACWDEVESRYPTPPPLSGEEMYYYDLEVAECLRDNGIGVPEAPTLETYLDQLATMDEDMWRPFGFVFGPGFWDLQRECGPDPWFR